MERAIGTDIVVPKKMQHPAFSKNAKLTPVTVYTNHYNFTLGVEQKIYQWDIKFEPEVPSDSRQLIQAIYAANRKDLLAKIGPHVKSDTLLYNFQTVAIEDLLFFDGHEKYKIRLRRIDKTLRYDDLLLTSDFDKSELLKIVNSYIKQCMLGLTYSMTGRKKPLFYDIQKTQKCELLGGDFPVDIFCGYYCTTDVYRGYSPKLMIECGSKIIRHFTLLQEYEWFKNEEKMPHDSIVDKYIIGKIFMANYGNNRTYVVEGIAASLTPRSPFPKEEFVDYAGYFKKRYGIRVEDKDQFLVFTYSKTKILTPTGYEEREEKIYLIPELLRPTGIFDEIRKDSRSMMEIHKFTKLFPDTRAQRCKELISKLNKNQPKSNNLNLKIDLNSNKVKGFYLEQPKIIQSGKSLSDGNFVIRKGVFDKNAWIKNWVVICSKTKKESCEEFLDTMADSVKELKIKFDRHTIAIEAIDPNLSTRMVTDVAIREVILRNTKAEGFLIYLDKSNVDRVYRKIKEFTIMKQGVITQFFRNLKGNKNRSVATKLLIQMISKVGQVPWQVKLPASMPAKSVMIVGADVFHMNMHSSVASVVSTLDKGLSSFFSQTSIQPRKGDDILADIADKVRAASRKFRDRNATRPDIIVVYRDGVSEGMIDSVRHNEVRPLLKGLQEEFSTENIEVIYMIVNKRIGDRFSIESSDGYCSNPGGGLIVHESVTKDNRSDFFMVAPKVDDNLGTAKPVYFNIVYNSSKLHFDTILELTYHQCFNYSNWCSGAIKVPGICMLAQRQGLLIGQTCKPNEKSVIGQKLSEKPYYI